MNLQEQHFLIDIDNTVTRYRKEASASGATLFGNCFLPVVRDLMIRRGWEREAGKSVIKKNTRGRELFAHGLMLFPDFLETVRCCPGTVCRCKDCLVGEGPCSGSAQSGERLV